MDLLACLLGLPALAGMNPYATAFMVGLLLRMGAVQDPVLLGAAFEPLSRDGWLAAFGVLALTHSLADKIPVLNHVNDALHVLAKPFAGALLALAAVNAVRTDRAVPLLLLAAAMTVGATVTLIVHGARSMFRAAAAKISLGTATPVLSAAEDCATVGGAALAVLHPAAFTVVAIGVSVAAGWIVMRGWRATARLVKARHVVPSVRT